MTAAAADGAEGAPAASGQPPLAIVTGAARGMGREYCLTLGRAGFAIAGLDIDAGGLAALSAALTAEGVPHRTLAADVCDEAAVAQALAQAEAALGPVEVLVNNAGGALGAARLEETALEDWNRTLALNLTSQFLCIRAVLPGMRGRGRGSIVNIASTAAFSGITAALYRDGPAANLVAYVAAKGGVMALTRALARDLGSAGIRVNAVAPGFTPTARVRAGFAPQAMARMAQDQAFARSQQPQDTAGAVAFLASPASAFMTGQVLRVDGGASMG